MDELIILGVEPQNQIIITYLNQVFHKSYAITLFHIPMTFISQSSIPVLPISSPMQVELYPGGRSLMNTIPRVMLLTVMFIIEDGHPDIGSWWNTKCLGSRNGWKVSLSKLYIENPVAL